MEKPEIRPRHPKTPEPMATKIGRGDYVPDICITIRLCNFAPAYAKLPQMFTRLVFLGDSNSLPPRPLHRYYPSIRWKTSFRARVYLLGSRKRNLTSWPYFFAKTTEIFGLFSTEQKISAQKGL